MAKRPGARPLRQAPAAPRDAVAILPACLREPAPRGWPRLQAAWVDRIKRAALRQLHASAAGERLLLRIYLVGEEATEIALQDELLAERPTWLERQMAQHLDEERAHARAFAQALAERGAPADAGRDAGPGAAARPDRLSARKIARWRRIAHAHAPRFAGGVVVPAFAIGLCAEQMAERVLRRHCDEIGPGHALAPLLGRVLADERRHVRLCQRTLARLVAADEVPALEALLREIRAVDRAFGVAGALAMLAAGLALRWRPIRREELAR